MRRAKIVATIGPACQSPEVLRKLIRAGMEVARLNFSHGDYESHQETIAHLRRLSEEMDRPVSILQDLQGIKIRIGSLQDGKSVELRAGQDFVITTRSIPGNRDGVSTSYQTLPRDAKAGDRLLLSDGSIELRVLSTSETDLLCKVVSGGILAPNQGINLPGVSISAPPVTGKDLRDLEFGIRQNVDYVALSFVRRADDILELKDKLEEKKADIPVIAKLERPMAIENLDAILQVCEGVMVARGDLGVEMSPEKVPIIQKEIIERANRERKIVITATQMLESMIHSPRPTRAEASDVANAVFDGTDALMLSGETARGRYPVESVEMMARIISEAEKLEFHSPLQDLPSSQLSFPEAVCRAAYYASRSVKARAIIAFTQTGSTARLISKYRPRAHILASTPHEKVMNRMALYWGIKPLRMQEINNVDELIVALEKLLLQQKLVSRGDNIIILTGAPILEKGHTSLMKLHTVEGDA